MAKEKEQQLIQDVETLQNKILELEERRKSLQESENLLSIITRTTSLSIFIIQNDKVCFINKAGETLFGLKASDIYQSELETLVSAEDFAFIKSDKIVNPGETLADKVKIRITNSIKGERIVEITVVSIFYKGKIAFACTAYDTTSYNHSNDISEDNQLLLKIIDSLPIGVSLSDVHGTIIAENKIMHDIWQNGNSVPGNDKIKVYNSTTHELIKQDEWIVTRALQNSEKILNEVVDIDIENNKKTINISAIPLQTDTKDPNGLILICEDITKLKHAKQALRRSEEYYRSLFENMREGFAFCQMLFDNDKPVDFICLDVNNAFGELTGLTNTSGKRITEVLPGLKSSNPELFEICGRVAGTGKPERSEVFLDVLGIWLSVSVYCPEKGYFILVFDNITKKKQADDALRESEERFRRIFKEGPIGVVIVGLNLRFTNANNRFCDMVGYTKNELTARTITDITYTEDADIDIKQAEALLNGDIPYYNMDKRFVRKDGSVFWCNFNSSLIRDRNNNPLYYLSLIEDITAKKEAEFRIIESEEQYRTLAKNFPNGMVFLFDHELRYRIADGTALRESGSSSEMTEGSTIWEVYPSDIAAKLQPHYKSALIGEKNTFELEYSGKIFEIITLPIKNINGEITGGMALTIDITQRKNNEIMLKELIAGKDKFFSIIAHDLKNPFTSLLGFSEMLSSELESLDNGEIKDLSFTIHKSAKNIYNLLDNLLQWSKIQSGRIDFIPGCFSINEIIEQAVSIFLPNAIRKKITLVSQIDLQLFAYADKNMIDTVIRNLLSNAIKFTHNGGRVKISAQLLDSVIIVTVTDSGIGLNSEQINKLFNINEQNSTAGTDKEKGTGLGLILCKEFVEKNNGTINVESEPGKGSKFTFSIPAKMN